MTTLLEPETTFLEYVCRKTMGEPTWRTDDRTGFDCPACGDTTAFGTLPYKPQEYKDRVYCHCCGFMGDEFDLLKKLYPMKDYGWRRVILPEWKSEFKNENPFWVDIISPRRTERLKTKNKPDDVAMAWANIGVEQRLALAALRQVTKKPKSKIRGPSTVREVFQQCEQEAENNNCTLEAIADYQLGFDEWVESIDESKFDRSK